MLPFPDPVLTANIYCSNHLDAVIFQAVAPFWREFRSLDCEHLCFLWLMRYGKGGEHLKIRIHGPEAQCPLLRELLEKKVTALLDSLPEVAATRRARRAPAVDVEDEGGDHLNHTLLWTTYRRSHVSLGGKPFLSDDHYTALLTRCLGAGCEMMLALEPDASVSLPHAARQRALLGALAAGLAGLGFPAGKRAAYLAYHRDWLLRSILPMDQCAEEESVEQLRRGLDGRVSALGTFLLTLSQTAETECAGNQVVGSQDSGPQEAWRWALADLLEYISPLCQEADYRLDPFASDPIFAPIFKVFHGFSNQLGLKQADEALAHHLLLRLTNT
ncbi:MAG TPA: lantibiotic dehydratase C-terminal domain-containing protein [Thermoanaerobaculia bacterium]|nr:lantibiotic dehydratase C-terminal domain-containing protein [Thermoanaerobaculia bacterium]